MTMSNTALITGASSGIGAEFARIHAAGGGDVVLVARSEGPLNALKSELESAHGINATVIVADLAEPDSAAKILATTEAAGIQVDVLINNAGFGGHGKFHERDLAKDQAMMQVNMVTLTNLTHMYLQGMVQRNKGKLLHVASTAGFMPGPMQAVYYATKAYVISFSQAIAQELSDTNITSTVLCPGAVATGFVKAGNLEGVDMWEKAATPQSVAQCGYDARMKGKLVVINEPGLSFTLNWVLPLLPRKTVLKISERAMQKN
jgi:short-subunit dehydrogenase